jgi:hypothetical protein
MLDAPRHDWSFYEAVTRESNNEWIRGLTTAERFALCASMFNAIWNARQSIPGDWLELDRHRWQEKRAMRGRMLEAFRKLDDLRREQSAGNDPG